MKYIITTIILLTFSFIAIETNAQELVKQERELSPFSNIEVTKGVEVYISQGDTSKVEIEAEEHILSAVITEVQGDLLKLTIDDRYRRLEFKKSIVIVHITLPKLNSLTVNTASKVFGLTEFATENLKIDVTSNAEVVFDKKITVEGKLDISTNSSAKFISKTKSSANKASLTAMSKSEIVIGLDIENDIDCSATSYAKLTVNGKANDAMLSATTHAELKLRGLELQRANVVASTNAIIQITVKESLAATATYSGIINYSGKPKSVSKESTTGGKIR